MIISSIIFHLRYFKRSENVKKVRTYIELCSRGDWFVLYQLSKNLNRPFFMDFLVTLARTGIKSRFLFDTYDKFNEISLESICLLLVSKIKFHPFS